MVDADDILFVGMRWGSANFSFGEAQLTGARKTEGGKNSV